MCAEPKADNPTKGMTAQLMALSGSHAFEFSRCSSTLILDVLDDAMMSLRSSLVLGGYETAQANGPEKRHSLDPQIGIQHGAHD